MYAPILSSPEEVKIAFYEDLTHTIEKITRGNVLITSMPGLVEIMLHGMESLGSMALVK